MKEIISMNKQYKTYGGYAVEIIAIRPELAKPVIGIEGNELSSWSMYGEYNPGESIGSYSDLVEINPYGDFELDDKVLVKAVTGSQWSKAHFSHVSEDSSYPFHVFKWGESSYTTDHNMDTTAYQLCVKWEDRTDDMDILI